MQSEQPTAELERNVHEDETLQWVVHPSAGARFVSEGLGTLVGGVVLGLLLGAGVVFALREFTPFEAVAFPAAVALFVLVLAWSLRVHVARWLFGTFEYAATDVRLVRFGGVFGRGLSSVPFEGVQDAQYDISTIEKLFDVGTVTVDTDRGYETVRFPYVDSPAEFASAVTTLAENARTLDDTAPGDGTYEPDSAFGTEDPEDGIAENVYPDETLQWVRTPNRTSRLLRNLPGVVGPALVFGAFLGAGAAGANDLAAGATGDSLLVGVGVGAVTVLVVAALNAYPHLRGATQYAATDRRIIEYEDRWGKRLDSIPLAGVQDAEYGVSFTENRFDVGSVTVDTDRGYETMTLADVDAPADVAREITRLARSDVAARAVTDPGDVSVGEGVDPRDPSGELAENLHADESAHWVIRPDKGARFLADAVGSFPVAAIGATLAGAVAFAVLPLSGTARVLGAAGVALGFVVLMYGGNAKTYLFEETEYALTDDRLVDYSGAFGRTLSGVPLDGIQDAEYRTTYVEDRFDVGDVTVDTDKGYEAMRLRAVANPEAVARELSEVANAYRFVDDAGGAESASAATTTPASAAAGETGGEAPGAGSTTATDGVPVASASKRCPTCDAVVDGSAAFCTACGAEQPGRPSTFEADCPSCGGPVRDGDAHCRHCGTAVAAEERH